MAAANPMTQTITPAERRRGLIAILFCTVLWSLNGPFIKQLSQEYGQSGLAIAWWRSLFAGLILLAPAYRALPTLPRTRWWIPATLSFAAMCGLFVAATTQTQAANAIILQYTAPLWILALSPLLLGERPARRDTAVMPFVLAGILVIFFGQATTDLLGLSLALSSGVAFAFVVLSFRRLRDVDPLASPCVTNVATVLLLAPFAWSRNITPEPLGAWTLLILMGVVQMALPYVLLAYGLRRVAASEAALLTLLEPLLNPLWTFLWMGEQPTKTTMLGGGLILMALALRTRFAADAREQRPITSRSNGD